jgi:PKD repeat protein
MINMKRILYMTLVLPLMFISCQKTPVAHFSTDTLEPEVGHAVLFRNDSQNATNFEWDFGDGYISSEKNPSHVFTSNSKFDVTLTATSKSGTSDKASITLNVMIPTLLEIEVREYYDKYIIPGARVILYPTITGWDAQKNQLSEGFTDANGFVVFSNLDPFVYYVDVWEANHDNFTLRNEDVGFVRTPEILPHQINRFVAWVDKATHTKGVARAARQLIIKKIERRASDMKQPSADGGTENWLDLYNRRVIKK